MIEPFTLADAPRPRLSPTDISKFVCLDQCLRYLRLHLFERMPRPPSSALMAWRPYPSPHSSPDQAGRSSSLHPARYSTSSARTKKCSPTYSSGRTYEMRRAPCRSGPVLSSRSTPKCGEISPTEREACTDRHRMYLRHPCRRTNAPLQRATRTEHPSICWPITAKTTDVRVSVIQDYTDRDAGVFKRWATNREDDMTGMGR